MHELHLHTLAAQAFSCGDAALFATTCPRLASITFDNTPLCGPVYWGFAGLTKLSSLTLARVRTPHGAEDVGASMVHLHHLTSHVLVDGIELDEAAALQPGSVARDTEGGADDSKYCKDVQEFLHQRQQLARRRCTRARLHSDDVMPYLATLTALRSLKLAVLSQAGPDRFQSLSALTGLTSLWINYDAFMAPTVPTASNGFVWWAQHLAFVPSLIRLRFLRLGDRCQLSHEAAALLAAMPNLKVGTSCGLPWAWKWR